MYTKKKYFFINIKNSNFKNYKIKPLRKIDIQKIRVWRNEQISILRQNKVINSKEQLEYYENFIEKSFFVKKPKMILFSFLLSNECIGYGGFVHINWKKRRAELSFLLDTKIVNKKKKYEKYFKIFLDIIFKINHEQIKFKTIFTETYDIRSDHIKILENFGFKYKRKTNKIKLIDNQRIDSLIHEYKPKMEEI